MTIPTAPTDLDQLYEASACPALLMEKNPRDAGESLLAIEPAPPQAVPAAEVPKQTGEAPLEDALAAAGNAPTETPLETGPSGAAGASTEAPPEDGAAGAAGASTEAPLEDGPAEAASARTPVAAEDLLARARSLLWRERLERQGEDDSLLSKLEAIRVNARAHGETASADAAAFALGLLHMEMGSWAAAFEAFEMVRGRGASTETEVLCLLEQAEIRRQIGPSARAIQLCAWAMRILGRGGTESLRAWTRLHAARAYLRAGDELRSRHCLDRARDCTPPVEDPEFLCVLRRTESDRLRQEGRRDAAGVACAEAYALAAERLDDKPENRRLRASILRRWARLEIEQGAVAEGRQKIIEASALLDAEDRLETARLQVLGAGIDLEHGDDEAALVALRIAERSFRATRRYLDLARLLLLRGEVAALREISTAARSAAREGVFEARYLFRRLGRETEVLRCELWLDTLRFDRPAGDPPSDPAPARPPRVPRSRRLSQLGYLTADPTILRSLEPLESLARTAIPILILGESGTGKEVLARALHRAGGGRGPFIPVNCGALPIDLQESELFGHVRGAFTGAVADKIGLFEAADGGTLLLDEVGEMTPRAQVKLLRVLELGEVRRVGETRTRRVHVRVIAATNADLHGLIRGGRFRRDLYYRLCGLSVELPPLRDRPGDIPLLAGHFVNHFGNHDGPAPVLSPEALDRLLRHTWPGNVRELRFCMENPVAPKCSSQREPPDEVSSSLDSSSDHSPQIVQDGGEVLATSWWGPRRSGHGLDPSGYGGGLP